jgi:hypothetical protein
MENTLFKRRATATHDLSFYILPEQVFDIIVCYTEFSEAEKFVCALDKAGGYLQLTVLSNVYKTDINHGDWMRIQLILNPCAGKKLTVRMCGFCITIGITDTHIGSCNTYQCIDDLLPAAGLPKKLVPCGPHKILKKCRDRYLVMIRQMMDAI